MLRHLCTIIAAGAALVLLADPAGAQGSATDTVRVGNVTKRVTGRVKELQDGDAACYATLVDARGVEFHETADFALCERAASLVGRRVRLEYAMVNVLAAACGGNPDCRRTERRAVVVDARVLD